MLHLRRSDSSDPEVAVIITGAINSAIGRPDGAARLCQTARTIKSVREVLPRAEIFYVDGGVSPLDIVSKKELSNVAQEARFEILDLSDAEEIREIHELARLHPMRAINGFEGFYKSAAESMALSLAFQAIETRENSNFIKLSGRYWLEPSFKSCLTFFSPSSESSFGALGQVKSYLRPKVPECNFATSTITWLSRGFSGQFLSDKMTDAHRFITENSGIGRIVDLEHAFEKIICNENVERFRVFGVRGMLASTGRKTRI